MITVSERKNLKWICRRCVKTQEGLEIERDTELEKRCSFCGTVTWCFLVASSRLVKTTPQETAVEAESTEGIEAVKKVADEALEAIPSIISPKEKAPDKTELEAEPEEKEELNYSADMSVTEAEFEIHDSNYPNRQPEDATDAEKLKYINSIPFAPTEMPLEAEPETFGVIKDESVINEDGDIELALEAKLETQEKFLGENAGEATEEPTEAKSESDLDNSKTDKNATIARLEAELEALQK
jgi:hypothetical protein